MKTKRTKAVTVKDVKTYVLRPRKAAPTASPLVKRVMLTVESSGRKHYHDLIFTGTGLTVEEMFTKGFVGDVDLPGRPGETIETDVECGPAGQFPGEPVKGLVFRFARKDNGQPVNAQVCWFSYITETPTK